MIGVAWSTQIFIVNTGTYSTKLKNVWYSDKNSLCTTIGFTFCWLSILAFLQFVISVRISLNRSRSRHNLYQSKSALLGKDPYSGQKSEKSNGIIKEVFKHLFGPSREQQEEDERIGRAYGRVSRVDHISFDIEEQERILRQHILGTNLIQKDRSGFLGGAFGAGDEEAEEYGDEQENEMEKDLLHVDDSSLEREIL